MRRRHVTSIAAVIALQAGCGSRSGLDVPLAGAARCALLGSFQRNVTNPPGYGGVELLDVATAPNHDFGLLASFFGRLDLGSTQLDSSPGAFLDLVVARFSPDGALRWVRQVKGGNGGLLSGAIGFDAAGNAYIAVSSDDPIDLGLGVLPAMGFSDLVIAKFSPDGAPLESRRFGSPLNFVDMRAAAIDSSGNMIIVGSTDAATGHVGSVDFGGNALSGVNDDFDGFYAAYDASLHYRYAFRMASAALDTIDSVTIDPAGGALVGGYSEGPSSLPGLALPPASTGYLMRIAPDGAPGSALVAPAAGPPSSPAQNRFVSVAIDAGDASYAVGDWGASTDFAGHALEPGFRYAFFGGFEADGALRFEHYAPGDFGPSTELDRVAVDPSGNVLVAGASDQGMAFFAAPFDQRPGPVFGVFDAAGNPICARSLDAELHPDSLRIAIDATDGSVLVAGALGPPNPTGLSFVRIRP